MLIKCPGQSKDKMKKSPKTLGEHAGGSKDIRKAENFGYVVSSFFLYKVFCYDIFSPTKAKISPVCRP